VRVRDVSREIESAAMSYHDERCLCGECEVMREQSSHDAEIERIAEALGMDTSAQSATIEEIIVAIRELQQRANAGGC
jgi:alcohol dehydrogenase class IV